MISETDIVAGYMWLLGRIPTTVEIAAHRLHYGAGGTDSLDDFQLRLLASEEFRERRLRMDRHRRASRPGLDRRRLVFVHIEKCGGTTLHDMLCSEVPPDLVCPERHESIGDWTINELAGYELFSGHFNLAWCRSIPGELRVVTLLREPKARLLSLFRFWKAHRPDPGRDLYDLIPLARNNDAEQFFAHPRVGEHPSIRDAMAGQLTRTRAVYALEPDDPILADPAGVLARATAALEGLAAFGLLERFEDTRLLLNAALGLRMRPAPPRQVLDTMMHERAELAPVPPVAMTPELDRLLDRLTPIDRQLHARAQVLFERRIAAMASPPAAATGFPGAATWLRPLVRRIGRARPAVIHDDARSSREMGWMHGWSRWSARSVRRPDRLASRTISGTDRP